MQYKIIYRYINKLSTLDSVENWVLFQKDVEEYLQDGWTLHSSPFTVVFDKSTKLCQVVTKVITPEEKKHHEILSKKIWEIELKNYYDHLLVRTENCLRAEHITTLNDLKSISKSYLKKVPNFGKKSMSDLLGFIDAVNQEYGTNIILND